MEQWSARAPWIRGASMSVVETGPRSTLDLERGIGFAETDDFDSEGRRWLTGRIGRGCLIRRALLLADVVSLALAFVVAEALSPDPSRGGFMDHTLVHETGFFVATIPIWILGGRLYGLYGGDEARADNTSTDELLGVLHMLTIGVWGIYAAVSLTHRADAELAKFVVFWLVAVASVNIARSAARSVCRHLPAYLQRAVIVGAGEIGQLVARKLLLHPEYGIRVVGFVDAAPKERHPDIGDLTILGTERSLPEIIRAFNVERVIIAFSREPHERTVGLIRALDEFDLRIDVVPRFFELLPRSADVHSVEGLTLIGLPRARLAPSARLLKRGLDVVLSLIGVTVLSPLFVAIAVAIKLESPGPVLFRQVRMGASGRHFRIFKFRTMVDGADAHKNEFAHLNKHARNGGDARMFKIPDDPRVTRVGEILRRTSLDELPQLFNVLKGEMSLVGPRPLILEEDRHVYEWARKRLDVRPGMTGLWQVLGRDSIPFEEMVRLDYLYVTSWSLWSDICLLLRTIPSVCRGERRPLMSSNEPMRGSLL